MLLPDCTDEPLAIAKRCRIDCGGGFYTVVTAEFADSVVVKYGGIWWHVHGTTTYQIQFIELSTIIHGDILGLAEIMKFNLEHINKIFLLKKIHNNNKSNNISCSIV